MKRWSEWLYHYRPDVELNIRPSEAVVIVHRARTRYAGTPGLEDGTTRAIGGLDVL